MANRIRKRAVNVVMLNGEATGVLEVTIPGSQSMAYKIPRDQLHNCKTLGVNDFNSVYFLFGGIEKGKPVVYIGQAGVRNNGGAILTRLTEHDKKKDFWTEAFVFTNTNDLFGATELNFLENMFCKMAINADRYEVTNSNNPNQGNIRRREAELEPYVYDAESLLYILGYKVFDPIDDDPTPQNNDYDRKDSADTELESVELPAPPKDDLPVGEYIHSAMRNLADAGYMFSDEQLSVLLSKESSKQLFNINYPLLKVLNRSEDYPHHVKGVGRYYSPFKRGKNKEWEANNIFSFGGVEYLLTKETYEKDHNKEKFQVWYKNL